MSRLSCVTGCASVLVLSLWPHVAQAQPPVRDRVDQALLVGSMSASGIALGLTMSCTAARTCREVNPVMARFVDDPVRMTLVKGGANFAIHYGTWRLLSGKRRTLALAIIAAINVADAVHDVRQMRRLTQ